MANIEDVKLLGLEPSNKFVMFGCWNNLRNKNSGLEKTMNALNRYLIENKIDFPLALIIVTCQVTIHNKKVLSSILVFSMNVIIN